MRHTQRRWPRIIILTFCSLSLAAQASAQEAEPKLLVSGDVASPILAGLAQHGGRNLTRLLLGVVAYAIESI